MPKLFKTIAWSAVTVIVVAITCGLMLPGWFDRTVLWFGLMFVLGMLAGIAWTVYVLNDFQMTAEDEDAPCVHSVRSLGWFVRDMVGPRTACGYSRELGSCALPATSSRRSRSLHVGDYEIKPSK